MRMQKHQSISGGERRSRCLPAITVIASLLAACSSVTSRFSPQDDKASVDGLVYTLPATELQIAVTYELTQCEPVVVLKLADLQVASQVVPDPEGPRFEIDVKELYGFSTSINPAKFQFTNGLLKSVEFKPQSEISAFLKQVVQTSTQLRANMTREQNQMLQGELSGVPCEELAKQDLKRLGILSKTMAELTAAIDAQNSVFSADPSLANAEKLGRLEARLTTVSTAATLHRNNTLLRGTTARLIFRRGAPAPTLEPDLTAFADWFGSPVPAAAAALARLDYQATAHAETRVDAKHDARADGVFYRLPGRASFVITHPMSAKEFRLNDIELMQLGPIGFLEIKNRAFQRRGITVAFDDKGQLTSFEAVSTAVAKDIVAVPTDALSEQASAEITALERELALLKKQKELIDAQQALDGARSGSQ